MYKKDIRPVTEEPDQQSRGFAPSIADTLRIFEISLTSLEKTEGNPRISLLLTHL